MLYLSNGQFSVIQCKIKTRAYRTLLNFCGLLRSSRLCGELLNVAIFILDNGSMARNKEGIGIRKY